MMFLAITPKTSQVVENSIPIRLPKWLWKALEARATSLHGGDLECCVNQLLQVGIDHEIKIKGVVGPLGRN